MAANTDETLLDQMAVSRRLHKTESTIEKWRCTGDGPPFIKVGRKPLYRPSDIDAWLTARTVSHTQQGRTVKRSRPRTRVRRDAP